MLRPLLIALFACAFLPGHAAAQKVGDTVDALEAALGRPPMVRTTSAGEVWVYSDGLRVTVKDGVAVEVAGLDLGQAQYASGQNVSVVPERERPPARDASAPSLAAAREEPPAWVWTSIGALFLVVLICKLLILIRAFSNSILWGLGSLLVPFVSLIFVVCHWSDVKRPFLVGVSASLSMGAVFVLGEMSTAFALH